MKYLFFDTETNGFPPKARMTQLAFMLIDIDENNKQTVLQEYANLIIPDVWTVPKQKFFIDNNMSTERCEKEGVPLIDALNEFKKALDLADIKVAHNIKFDNQIVGKELRVKEFDLKRFEEIKEIDTMHSTTEFCKLPGRHGNYKWAKLTELYDILFKEEFNAHDALDDVRAMVRCFIELKEKHGFYQNV